MLRLFSLVCRCRKSIIFNQIFCKNYCFLLHLFHLCQFNSYCTKDFFLSLISFAWEYFVNFDLSHMEKKTWKTRISHRAMNQNKNHKHVKKVGTPHNFCLIFTGELEKQLFIKKLLKWDNKLFTPLTTHIIKILKK